MHLPSGLEILTAPWTGVSLLSRIILALQIAAIGAGVARPIRKRVRRVAWFVGLFVGPPLLWTLFGISVGLLFSFNSTMHYFSLGLFYGWLLQLPIIIGATLLLQCVLAWQYANGPLRSLPIVGVAFGILAILGDVVFLLYVVTPLGR